MLTGNPIEIALAIFVASLVLTAVAAIVNAVADKNRPETGTGAAINGNSPPSHSAEGIVRRNKERAA